MWLRVTVTPGPELSEVLEAGGKGVAPDADAKLVGEADELEVEAFAGDVGIGVHVEIYGLGFLSYGFLEHIEVLFLEEGGRGDGNGFAPGGEHGHAVGDAFGNPKLFAGTEVIEDGEVVDATAGASGETEPGEAFGGAKVAALHTEQATVDVPVGDEQGGGVEEGTAVAPAGGGPADAADAQPVDDSRTDVALGEEEVAGLLVELGMLDQIVEPFPVGLGGTHGLRGGRLLFGKKYVVLVGQPLAGFEEGLVEHLHGEVDDASVGFAHKAVIGVGLGIKGEAGVSVLVKGAKGLVPGDGDAQPTGDGLDGNFPDFL